MGITSRSKRNNIYCKREWLKQGFLQAWINIFTNESVYMQISSIGVWSAKKFELVWGITSFLVYLVQ